MVTIRKAVRQDNADVVRLWHCPSFKVMLPKAVQDGLPPDRAYLGSAASGMIKSGGLHLILDGEEPVGTLNRFGPPASPEIGWFVAEARRREGIAFEAVTRFVDDLLRDGAETVRFGMFASNEPSVRLVGRLGLVPVEADGAPEGHVRYAVDADAWRARPSVATSPPTP